MRRLHNNLPYINRNTN